MSAKGMDKTKSMDRVGKAKLSLKEGERAALVSSGVTALLAVSKGLAGFFSGSVALMADAVHSFSDIFGSAAVWLGLRIAQRKPTDRFPYGYYRAESLASLVVSVIVILTGLGIFLESYDSFLNPSALGMPFLGLAVALFSILASFGLAVYKNKIGKKIKSPALLIDSKHSMADVFSSMIVFGGIFASIAGFSGVEGIAGMVIAVLVLSIGVRSAKNTILVLMDAWTDPLLEKKIARSIKGVNGVGDIHELKLRKSGPFIMGEAHIEVEGTLPVEKADDIRREIEARLAEKVERLDSLLLQIEPSKLVKFRLAVSVSEDKGMDSKIGGHFGKAPYFAFVDLDGEKIRQVEIKKNPAVKLDRRIGVEAANFIIDNRADVLAAMGIGESPFHILKSNLVRIFTIEGETLGDVVGKILKNELKDHKEPERK